MTSLRANFPDILDVSFRKIVQNAFAQPDVEYSKLFNILDSKKATEKESSISGFPTMPTKSEGTGILYFDPLQGYDVTYTHLAYGMGFRVSEEMYEDDQHSCFRPFNKMSTAMTESAIDAQEVAAWNVLNRAFNSSYTGGDALELCSDVHTLTGGGTASNELATPADLSLSSLQQAVMDMETTVNDMNMPRIIKPVKLWVPTELDFVAAELLESELKPNSADNTKNVIRNKKLTYEVSHYLTDADAWFLAAEKAKHQLIFFWRKKPFSRSDVDFDTWDLKFSLGQRFCVGFSDWRGIFGTPGAG